MKLYVYCVVEGIDAQTEVTGISGAPVGLQKVDGLAVLVSEFNGDAVPVTRANALSHAAVVRSVLDQTTPLPFRFGTLVTEPQLESYVSARKPALETKLAHVRDCVEMSVKIIWEAPDTVAEQHEVTDDVTDEGAGATFLAAKRREILGGQLRSAQAAELSTWLHERVRGLTRDEQVTVRPEEKLVLAAAHLIERSKIRQYREKIAEARQDRPELHFLASGPWPPYSFANIELEFKTQFGVS